MNEFLLIINILIIYSLTVLAGKLFGKSGISAWIAISTILANIEVLVLIDAFGMNMTLGNILFASTFLATDILSEVYGQKTSKAGANIGIMASVSFLIMILIWPHYIPAENDLAFGHLTALFEIAPRTLLASLIAYIVVERFDIFAYHFIWKKTFVKTGDRKSLLWLRNNLATLLSQLINSILYTFLAFYKVYDSKTLTEIILSGFAIFAVTSLLDTPFVYLARRIIKSDDAKA